MEDLTGKVAVVTGGAGGIGRALGEELLAEGMKLVVADLHPDAVAAAVADLGERGEVTGVVTDVSDFASVEALADATYAAHGACHLLVNNAGVGAPSALVWDTTPNDWRWVHGVNVMGVTHGILAFVPRMLAGGEPGHVVNTSSGDGGISPLPSASVYASSKAAVTVLTECLAQQLIAEGTNLRASIFYPVGRPAAHRPVGVGAQPTRRADPRAPPLHRAHDRGQARGHGRREGLRAPLAGPQRAGPARGRRHPRRRLHLHDRPPFDRRDPAGAGLGLRAGRLPAHHAGPVG